MPKGFRTLIGPRPDWAREFGLTEHASAAYPPRTYQNVRDSDITIRIALNFDSAGERCTAAAISRYGRPSLDVQWTGRRFSVSEIIGAANKILAVHAALKRPVVVNFAGNSEKTACGIERAAETFVRLVIRTCEER